MSLKRKRHADEPNGLGARSRDIPLFVLLNQLTASEMGNAADTLQNGIRRKSARLEHSSSSATLESGAATEDTHVDPVNDCIAPSVHDTQLLQSPCTQDPIHHWIETSTWPVGVENRGLDSSNMPSTLKRLKNSAGTASPTSASQAPSYASGYSASKGGRIRHYSLAWQIESARFGLCFDTQRHIGELSDEAKEMCQKFLTTKPKEAFGLSVPTTSLQYLFDCCQEKNETRVFRDITPCLIPPIVLMQIHKISGTDYCSEELGSDWSYSTPIFGPRPRSDVAIGLTAESIEAPEERSKLLDLIDNPCSGKITPTTCFPFLMCEVKKGISELEVADRQNMHSCSIAIKSRILLQELADAERKLQDKEPLAPKLHGQILVFSISHNLQEAKLYGHYPVFNEATGKWTYCRHLISSLPLMSTPSNHVLVNNFARNVISEHAPTIIRAVIQTINELPFLDEPTNKRRYTPSISNVSTPCSPGFRLLMDQKAAEVDRLAREKDELLEKVIQMTQRQNDELEKERKERQADNKAREAKHEADKKEAEAKHQSALQAQEKRAAELIKMMQDNFSEVLARMPK